MRINALFCFFLFACSTSEPKTEIVQPNDVTPNPAMVLPVGVPRIVAPGIVQPKNGEIEVAAEGPGLLKEILVKEGEQVKAGQVLARYDATIEEARVAAAQAQVDAAEAASARVKRGNRPQEKAESAASASAALAKAQLSKDTYDREMKLLEKGATTQDAVDRAKRQAEADDALATAANQRAELIKQGFRAEERTLALADVDSAKAQLQEALAALKKREIIAPSDGLILEVLFESGEYYSPAAGPLLRLGDMDHSEIILEVDELDVPRVSLGQKVIITADGYQQPVTRGVITQLSPRMSDKNLLTGRPQERSDIRVLRVTVTIETHDLRSGLRVWGTVDASPNSAH